MLKTKHRIQFMTEYECLILIWECAILQSDPMNQIQWLILGIYRWQRKWIPYIQTVCSPGYPNREWTGKLESIKDCLKDTAKRLESENPERVTHLMLNLANQSSAEITHFLEKHFYSDEILQ